MYLSITTDVIFKKKIEQGLVWLVSKSCNDQGIFGFDTFKNERLLVRNILHEYTST